MTDNHDSLTRRNFLRGSGAAATALAVGAALPVSAAFAEPTSAQGAPQAEPKRLPIGLELYAVRTELARDLPHTLRTVAKIGFEAVEFYSPYTAWTMPYAKDVRTQLDDLGLRCYSTHNSIESITPGESMAKAIELNQILGVRQVVVASAPRGTEGLEGWKRLCGQFTTATEQLKPHGLVAGFHNHAAEWAKLDGDTRVMDFIAANTPRDFVLQLDVGTCVEAGADPVAWVKANPGRIRSVHLKDWAPGSAAEEKGYRVLFGEGVAPWQDITAALETVGGVELYLLEQEGSRFSEFESAQRGLTAWKALRAKRG